MRKLPVFAAVGHSISTVMDQRGPALRMSWPWFLILFVAGFVLFLVAPQSVTSVDDLANPDPSNSLKGSFAGFLYMLLFLVAFTSIAVNWHRYILTNEMPVGATLIRADGLVARYIGNSFLLGLIIMIPLFVGLFLFFGLAKALGAQGPVAGILGALLAFAGVIAMLGYAYRLVIKLPAIALGRTDYTFSNALRDTRDNFWQIIGFSFLAMIVIIIPALFLELLNRYAFPNLGISGVVIAVAANLIFQWFSTMFSIANITSMYGFFVEGREF
jgi:hypothetical protein